MPRRFGKQTFMRSSHPALWAAVGAIVVLLALGGLYALAPLNDKSPQLGFILFLLLFMLFWICWAIFKFSTKRGRMDSNGETID
ncbi:MAG TPA: hypothetical protein VMD27_08165 [Candidatus Aquilonibacter sp.]|nr:hypothetical protein [Candidatus Aquilonibacter sp.]